MKSEIKEMVSILKEGVDARDVLKGIALSGVNYHCNIEFIK